ncbi:MAG: thermonuclease family protein [Arenicellales bacterium]
MNKFAVDSKRALIGSALFVWALLIAGCGDDAVNISQYLPQADVDKPSLSAPAATQPNALMAPASAKRFKVKRVIDGDTITLKNGDKVRFVGINTPELGHGKFRDEPLANVAKRFVQNKLKGKSVLLETGNERKDRHGRVLAHVYTESGESIQSQLLEKGLAFAVAVGKNLRYIDQYTQAEQRARAAKKGVWGDDFYAPINVAQANQKNSRGYRRIQGKVERVSQSKNNQILHLKGDFRVLIKRELWKKYFKGKASRYKGKTITVRGWIFKSHGVQGLKIYHPTMLEVNS